MLPLTKPCSKYFRTLSDKNTRRDTNKCTECSKAKRFINLCDQANITQRVSSGSHHGTDNPGPSTSDPDTLGSGTQICSKHIRDPSGSSKLHPDSLPVDQHVSSVSTTNNSEFNILEQALKKRKYPTQSTQQEQKRSRKNQKLPIDGSGNETNVMVYPAWECYDPGPRTDPLAQDSELITSDQPEESDFSELKVESVDKTSLNDILSVDPLKIEQLQPPTNELQEEVRHQGLLLYDEVPSFGRALQQEVAVFAIKVESPEDDVLLHQAGEKLRECADQVCGKEEPSIQEFTDHGPVVQEPTVEQSTVEPSTVEPSTVEQSTVEQSTVEQSTVEQSTVEQSTREQSTVEQPMVEECTDEESTVQGRFHGPMDKGRRDQTDRLCAIQELINIPFRLLSIIEQFKVMKRERPMPEIRFLHSHAGKDAANPICYTRPFGKKDYLKFLWVAGSEALGELFCWPCLLFGMDPEKNGWNLKGLSNIREIYSPLSEHEKSTHHLSSLVSFTMFGKDRVSLQPLAPKPKQNKLEVETDVEILRRLVDAICLLPKMEMPVGTHNNNRTLLFHKMYLDVVSLFSEYDQLLKYHLQTASGKKLLSIKIRNKLITSIETVLLNKIKEEVEGSNFVSILLGETSDSMSESRVSTVLRYVDKDGILHERFVGYSTIGNNKSARTLDSHIIKVAEKFNIGHKLVAISYDRLIGLEDLGVVRKFPLASFIHCFSFSLRSVLKNACLGIKKCQVFLTTLSRFAVFFSACSKQRNEFESFMTRKLANFKPSMLDFTSSIEMTTFRFHPQILEFFEIILENPENWDEDRIVDVYGYKAFLEDFSNIFLLRVFTKILAFTDGLYEVQPQEIKFTNFSHCAKRVEKIKLLVHAEPNNFNQYWKDVEAKRGQSDISLETSENQGSLEQSLDSAQEPYKQLHCQIIDLIYNRLTYLFASTEKLKILDLLDPYNFKISNPIPECLLSVVDRSYSTCFDLIQLKNELLVLYGVKELRGNLPHDLIESFTQFELKNQFAMVHKLVCFYLTIPCTQATLIPSFSAQKRMTCVHESLGHHRESKIALMTVENRFLSQLKELPDFYTGVTSEFTKSDSST